MTLASTSENSTPILIVGGGLAGLSAAMFLAWRGIPNVVVERHPGSSLHPRAIGFTIRTMEMFRAVGIESAIPSLPMPQSHGRPRRIAVESLAGKWSTETEWTPGKSQTDQSSKPLHGIEYSPCTGAAIAQDRLEPIIRARAIEFGADVRMNTSLTSFEQDAHGVTAQLRHCDGGEYSLRTNYMIAADGHKSLIREALQIGRSGHGHIQTMRSVLFRAPLDEYLEKDISQFVLDQPDLKGMLTTYRDGRWLLMFLDDEERDAATLKAKVIQAIGRSDLDIELITTGRWVLSALIANTFISGRIFLTGDAAHTLPPARGGYGANTGIEDSFNIAWKLASVLSGTSSPELLDTYDAERRPIAWLRHNQIFARQDYAHWATDEEKKATIIEDEAMELGQLYRSKSVLGASDQLPPALRPEQWAGQPGTRAPHLWVTKDNKRVSTLDLVQRDWTLLTEDMRWSAAATEVSKQLNFKLQCLCVGSDLLPPVNSNKLTLDTPIELIVANVSGKAVLDTNISTLSTHEKYETFKSLSLRQLQPMSRGLITDTNIDKTEADLAAIQCDVLPPDPEVFRKELRMAFGIESTGASLIRPDGYVAWRSIDLSGNPARTLADVLTHVSFALQRSSGSN